MSLHRLCECVVSLAESIGLTSLETVKRKLWNGGGEGPVRVGKIDIAREASKAVDHVPRVH
jgi:hypothetical protein